MGSEPVNLWWAVPTLGIGAFVLGACLFGVAVIRFLTSKEGPQREDLWWLIPFLAIGPIQLAAFFLVLREGFTTDPVLYVNGGGAGFVEGFAILLLIGLFGLGFVIWLGGVVCIFIWWYLPRSRSEGMWQFHRQFHFFPEREAMQNDGEKKDSGALS